MTLIVPLDDKYTLALDREVAALEASIAGTVTAGTLGAVINAASVATLSDATLVPVVQSSVTLKTTFTAIKAFLKTYFDTVYQAAGSYQPLDSDLTTIAGLTATTDSFIQSKASAWASRTIAQVKTDLGLSGTNSGDQSTIVGISGTMAQFDTAVSDGNIVYQGQALGTPLSGTATNLTGTASGLTAGNVTTNANLSGDVSSVGNTTTIGAGKVTLAMQANMATASVVYRKTAGSGAPEVNTLATLKTDLGLTGTNSGDQTSIVGITGTTAQFNTALTDGDFATGGGTASGTNTGDQTSIVGITGTTAQFNTALSDADFATGGGTASGTNTGDNATNTQYSGLAASKQDTLVSGTTIKTINGSTVLGSGDLVVATSASDTNRNLYISTADVNLPANYSIYYPSEYEVGSGFVYDIASAAIMEIG